MQVGPKGCFYIILAIVVIGVLIGLNSGSPNP